MTSLCSICCIREQVYKEVLGININQRPVNDYPDGACHAEPSPCTMRHLGLALRAVAPHWMAGSVGRSLAVRLCRKATRRKPYAKP